MAKWIDISQPLTNDMAHFPGDTPFSYSLTYSKEENGTANIGQMTASLHNGTHIDAPFHYDSDGKTVDQLDLERYVGNAMVVDVSHVDHITPEVFQGINLADTKRVLLRTALPNNPKRFPKTMPAIDPEIAPYLQEKGVLLLGVDMPSVDAPDSKELATHHALYKHDINILENLMLDEIDAGMYELIALPLAIQGADGSPVRAVIRPLKDVNNHG
ncbi:Kynurenine formamidase [Oceanobacillus limi]|uniref:Kynurenine formamidase n=1 Tax=Oceanobacillus limi TaxID=930131 RepID=A0A1I0DZT9_9BACI|nr:arylformamidase [Oceanobacillus limi]SET38287.1 Kynurenine formamidase [Oceanobacillus limi]